MKRIILVANKNWEAEGALSALLSAAVRPPTLPLPTVLHYPWLFPQGSIAPRAVWNLPTVIVELWCIQDIMAPGSNSSSSEAKHDALPYVLTFNPSIPVPDLVVALGTAAYGSATENHNGCVIVGSNIFLHDFHPAGNENPDSKYHDPANFDKLITSTVGQALFDSFDQATLQSAQKSLLMPFFFPAQNIRVIADKNYAGISTVNVTKTSDYPTSDPQSMNIFNALGTGLAVGSVESTHGITRLLSDAPFLFISGIVDRFTLSNTDIFANDPDGIGKSNAQNFTGAFNMGAALSWLLPLMINYVSS